MLVLERGTHVTKPDIKRVIAVREDKMYLPHQRMDVLSKVFAQLFVGEVQDAIKCNAWHFIQNTSWGVVVVHTMSDLETNKVFRAEVTVPLDPALGLQEQLDWIRDKAAEWVEIFRRAHPQPEKAE